MCCWTWTPREVLEDPPNQRRSKMTSDDAGTKETVPIVLQRLQNRKKNWAGCWKPWGKRKDMLQRQRNKGAKVEGVGLCQVRCSQCLFYSGKVPMTTGGWQTRPPRKGKWGYSWWGTDWQLKTLMREKQDNSRWTLTSVNVWQLKSPRKERERLQETSTTNQHERYRTRYREQQSVQPQLPLFHSIPFKPRLSCWTCQLSFYKSQVMQ